MKKHISPLVFILIGSFLQAQTIQFQFCGKTATVTPSTDPGGNDQREKASIHLDFIKIGQIGNSKTNPVYVLGETGVNSVSFATKVIADKCENNTNQTNCSGCTTCTTVTSSTNGDLGNISGKILGNAKVETKNNSFVMMSTNVNNLICYETNKINISTLSGKKAEITVKYEGRSQGFAVHNISLNYRYNNDNYFVTPFFFNKNSNNVGVFEETYVIIANVPVGVEDLSKKLSFELTPNPVREELLVSLETYEKFDATISILDENGREHKAVQKNLEPGASNLSIGVADLPAGWYLLKIADQDGRISTKKFTRI
ncbi:MAG: T9SS type A sorting domain-containing protein [Saprospiraceae bacterium]|nr:T9SS type A sorting domain-containing protein [Saprospiraceae bacterium]